MTQLVKYQPMWYLLVHWNYEDHYYLPMEDIEKIMEIISSKNAPKYLDLRKYWYGRESCSMIRWAKELNKVESELHFEILKYDKELRPILKHEIEYRKKRGLFTDWKILSLIAKEKEEKLKKQLWIEKLS